MLQAFIIVSLALQVAIGDQAQAEAGLKKETNHLEVYAVNTGVKFVRDYTYPEHGLAYRDTTGLIWFEPSHQLIYDLNAQEHCRQKSGARLPLGSEFIRFRNSFTFDTTVNYGVTSTQNPGQSDKVFLFPLIPVNDRGHLHYELSLVLSNNINKKDLDEGYLPDYQEMGGQPLWLNLENRNLYGIGDNHYRIFCVKEANQNTNSPD